MLSSPALVLTFRDLPKLFLPNIQEINCHVSTFDEVALRNILDSLRLASKIISTVDEVEKIDLWSISINVDFLGRNAGESFLVLLNLEEDYGLKISVSGSLKNIKFLVAPGTLFSIEVRRCTCLSNIVKVSVTQLASKEVCHEIEVVLPRTGKREAIEHSIAVLDKLAGTSLDSLVHEVKRELERLMEEQTSD